MHNRRKTWRKVMFAAVMVSEVSAMSEQACHSNCEVTSVGGSFSNFPEGSRKI